MKKIILITWIFAIFFVSFVSAEIKNENLLLNLTFNNNSDDTSTYNIFTRYYINGTAGFDFKLEQGAKNIFGSVQPTTANVTFDDVNGSNFYSDGIIYLNNKYSQYLDYFTVCSGITTFNDDSINKAIYEGTTYKGSGAGTNGGYNYYLRNDDYRSWGWHNATVNTFADTSNGVNVSINVKYHTCGTWNRSHNQLLLNGTLADATDQGVSSIGEYTLNFTSFNDLIGQRNNLSDNNFNGSIEYVFLYDRVLSSNDINLFLNGGNFTDNITVTNTNSLYFDGQYNFLMTENLTDNPVTIMYWIRNSSGLYHVVNSSGTLYLNGTVTTDQGIFKHYITDQKLFLGKKPGNPYTQFETSNLKIYNQTLSEAEIQNIYTSEGGTITEAGIIIEETKLTNDTRQEYDEMDMQEEDAFYIKTNVTNNGDNIPAIECSFNTSNVNANFFDFSDNISIDSTTPYNTTIIQSEPTSNIKREEFTIRLCYEGSLSRDVNIAINDNFYKTINSELIPDCSIGVHEERNVTTTTATTQINYSLNCPLCTGLNTMRIVSRTQPSLSKAYTLRWNREFTRLSEELEYNATDKNFWYNEHFYSYDTDITATNEINITCNGTTSTTTVTIQGVSPTADFLLINYDGTIINFNQDETIIESSLQTQILGECSNEIINFQQINITYSNGTIIKSADSETINVTNDELNINHLYTAVLYCLDDDGNHTTINRTFWANDTTNPTGTSITPQIDNTTEVYKNTQAQIQLSISDKNLYGLNYTCSHSLMGEIFSFFTTGITTTTFLLDNTTNNLTLLGVVTCDIEYCDDHTTTEFNIDELSIKTDSEKRNITINNKIIASYNGIYDVNDLTFIQKKDRLSYCYEFDTVSEGDKFTPNKAYNFIIPKKDGMEYRGKTLGHMANWNTKQWIDFEPEKGYDFRIDRIEEDQNNYYIYGLSDDNTLCFQSVGGLNCIEQSLSFDVIESPEETAPTTLDTISTGTAIFYGILTLIWIMLVSIGSITKNDILTYFGFFIGLITGLTLYTLNNTIATGVTLICFLGFTMVLLGQFK